MSTTAAAPAVSRPRIPNKKVDRAFFSIMVFLMLATVLVGFARTYFLAGMVEAPLPNRLIHIHGAVFSLWMVLVIIQTAFVATGNIRLHRKLGMFAFCWAVLMVVLGTFAAVDALHRGQGPLGLDPVSFFIIPITSIVLFAVLTFAAYRARRRPEAHKRLITIATISILDAAVGRWPVALFQHHPPMQDLVHFSFLLLIVLFDLFQLHRVSRSTLWASALLIVVHIVRVPIGLSHPWHALVSHLF
jgi:hypothetical protein